MFDTFYFDYQALFDDKIQSKRTGKCHLLKRYWNVFLPFETNSKSPKFPAKTLFINRLNKTRTQRPMNFDCRADDFLRQLPVMPPIHDGKLKSDGQRSLTKIPPTRAVPPK